MNDSQGGPTPAEYIAALKAQDDRGEAFIEATEAVRSALSLCSSELEVDFNEHNQRDYAIEILKSAWDRLPKSVQSLFDAGSIAVGEVNEPTFGAYSQELLNGHAIILHSTTHQFVFRIAHAFFTCSAPEGTGVPPLAFEETARLISDIVWWFFETGNSFGPEYEIDADQLGMANLITMEAMVFILFHEIGHAAIDHEGDEDFRITAQEYPHLDEYGADALGAMWTLGVAGDMPLVDPRMLPVRYAGIEFVFQIWALLQSRGMTFADTHPLPRERLESIRDIVRERCEDDVWIGLSSWSNAIETIFHNIADTFEDSTSYQEFVERRAAIVVSKFDQLIDRCATFPTPEYGTFHSEAGKILDRGFPEQLISYIEILAYEIHNASSEEQNTAEYALRMQKFKLLLGYGKQLPEPLQTAIKNALYFGRN